MFIHPRVRGANLPDPILAMLVIVLDILSVHLMCDSSGHFKGHFIRAKINTHVGYIELYESWISSTYTAREWPVCASHSH
jgi:hypothetical protein